MRDVSAQSSSADDVVQTPAGGSLIVHCGRCEQRQLLPESHVESKHPTSEGVIGYVRCAEGHLLIHRFAEAYPKPKPPASVIALRARQAVEQTATEHDAHAVWPDGETVSTPAQWS